MYFRKTGLYCPICKKQHIIQSIGNIEHIKLHEPNEIFKRLDKLNTLNSMYEKGTYYCTTCQEERTHFIGEFPTKIDGLHQVDLYLFESNCTCDSCGHHGAIQHGGNYYPNGLQRNEEDIVDIFRDVNNHSYFSYAMGFGGTIPYHCLNCEEYGLISNGTPFCLEGYENKFTYTIK